MSADTTEGPRERLSESSRAILHIIDAVTAHGDRAAIVAAHAALAKSSAPNVVDERNELRRQVVDLHDDLAAVKADRAAADIRAEDAEAANERVRAMCQRSIADGEEFKREQGVYMPSALDPEDVLAALDAPEATEGKDDVGCSRCRGRSHAPGHMCPDCRTVYPALGHPWRRPAPETPGGES